MRYTSLNKNLKNTHTKFQVKTLNSNQDINVQKIKVIKMV